jgi:hypothetical protein
MRKFLENLKLYLWRGMTLPAAGVSIAKYILLASEIPWSDIRRNMLVFKWCVTRPVSSYRNVVMWGAAYLWPVRTNLTLKLAQLLLRSFHRKHKDVALPNIRVRWCLSAYVHVSSLKFNRFEWNLARVVIVNILRSYSFNLSLSLIQVPEHREGPG